MSLEPVHRRDVLRGLAALGIGSVTFQRAIVAQEPKADATAKVTAEMVEKAEYIAGITLKPAEREAVASWLTRTLTAVKDSHKIDIPNSVPPAWQFQPLTGIARKEEKERLHGVVLKKTDIKRPQDDVDLAYLGIRELGHLLRSKQITSVELTKFFLARLRKYDPMLKCVVTFLDDIALKQAAQADAEFAKGKDLSPLQGIPWGAKDLISYPGAPTTWGAGHFQNQTLDTKAHVAKQLDNAGAVLVAKLTLGALAWGDIWFGGTTRNPWNNKQGSSGSSAGSASAVSAGLLPFAIGSETLGSIVSPSTRCGVTGLRPTFGRVSRAGCMTLAWTMDKLGPITRSVEDAAIVLHEIMGSDPNDLTAVDLAFAWPLETEKVKVGYVKTRRADDERPELKTLKDLGYTLVPIILPSKIPQAAMQLILDVECAAAFDDLTHQGTRDGIGLWAPTFQRGRFVSAVDYIRASRLRTMLIQEMAEVMKQVDVYIGGNDLFLTNMTGHPSVCLPNGFTTGTPPVPTAITMTGQLYGESMLLSVAHKFQEATGHHKKRPPLDKLTPITEGEKKS
jgi:Asp-tRNA(Asn)/Glu-tRNA(Gln) amidotransferase A subunit family amidase